MTESPKPEPTAAAAPSTPTIGATVARMMWGFLGVTLGYLGATSLLYALQEDLGEALAEELGASLSFSIIAALFVALCSAAIGLLLGWLGGIWHRRIAARRAAARALRPY